MLNVCRCSWEYQVQVSLRASKPPFPQGVHDHRPERNGSFARMGFRSPDLVVSVGTLPHMQLAALKVYVFPTKTTQFGSPQPGKDNRYEQCAPFARRGINQPLDFVLG